MQRKEAQLGREALLNVKQPRRSRFAQANQYKMFLILYAFSILSCPKRNAECVQTFGLYFFTPTRLPSVRLFESICLCCFPRG